MASKAIDELAAQSFSLNDLMQRSHDGTQRYLYLSDVKAIITAQEQRITELQERLAYLDNAPQLGLATTAQLIDELRARCELNGTLNYRTVDGD